jgi:hypothetical protein
MKIAIAVLLLAACAGPHQFSRRAAFEMNCPEEELEFVQLERNVYGVTGCGNRATYQHICGAAGVIQNGYGSTPIMRCDWVKAN